MRRFASKDSKRDFYILYTLVLGLLRGLFIISLREWKVFGVES